jgi:outer membrane protein assembly factor BamD
VLHQFLLVDPSPRRFSAILFKSFCAAAFLLPLTACSSSKATPEPEATEVKLSDAELRDAPEGVLFNDARRLYKAGLYSVSVESFDSLRLNYPNSPYAEFAEIKVADGNFETKEFATAANQYEEFVKNHPISPNVPYMLFRAGRSHQLLNRGVGRDVAPLKKALELYKRVLTNHPDSIYASEAKLRYDEVLSQIAAHEKFVMDFYKKQNNEKALQARQQKFEREWAHLNLKNLPSEELGTPAAPTMVLNQPPTTPKLLTAQKAGLYAESMRASLNTKQLRTEAKAVSSPQEGPGLRLQRIACEQNSVFIYLDKPIEDSSFVAKYKLSTPQEGVVSIQVPGGFSKDTTVDCYASKDLELKTSGKLTLKTANSVQVMTLDNPPRLMLLKRES